MYGAYVRYRSNVLGGWDRLSRKEGMRKYRRQTSDTCFPFLFYRDLTCMRDDEGQKAQ